MNTMPRLREFSGTLLDDPHEDSDGDGLTDSFETQRYVYEVITGSFTESSQG